MAKKLRTMIGERIAVGRDAADNRIALARASEYGSVRELAESAAPLVEDAFGALEEIAAEESRCENAAGPPPDERQQALPGTDGEE